MPAYPMDDETLHALGVIIADHFRVDPAGGPQQGLPWEGDNTGIEDLERLNEAYEIVAAWFVRAGGAREHAPNLRSEYEAAAARMASCGGISPSESGGG